jgi:arsenical pump membrane protein
LSASTRPDLLIGAICALVVFGIVRRPWRLPEAVWAVLGAVALVGAGLVPPAAAGAAVLRGADVYLFLTGMMLLSELARQQGLFDWLAALALEWARGSAARLFALVYAVGVAVTVLLSNDATAVVLTPAVYAVARRAQTSALPYLLCCAFVANAASFVLPISNPANLVVYGSHLPRLGTWLAGFMLPSLAAIAITYLALRTSQRALLRGAVATPGERPQLALGGRLAGIGIAATGCLLLLASALDWQLGWPTFIAGTGTTAAVALLAGTRLLAPFRGVAWGVIPLVAGLFVLVAGLEQTGLVSRITTGLAASGASAPVLTALLGGALTALLANLVNNLPMGLLAATVIATLAPGAASNLLAGALLIGVDLGPNLSVTGSLATILWLMALRRDGEHVSALSFLKVGSIVMPAALLAALLTYAAATGIHP